MDKQYWIQKAKEGTIKTNVGITTRKITKEVTIEEVKNKIKVLKLNSKGKKKEGEIEVELTTMLRAIEDSEEKVRVQGYNSKLEGFKRPRLEKKKKNCNRVIGYKKEIVDGKEIIIKVLEPGNKYYVGKSVPSGIIPRGTNKTEGEYEINRLKRVYKYAIERYEAANKMEVEQPGRTRKGGDADSWFDVIESMEDFAKEQGIPAAITID